MEFPRMRRSVCQEAACETDGLIYVIPSDLGLRKP